MISYKTVFSCWAQKMLLNGDPLEDILSSSSLFQDISKGKGALQLSGFAAGLNVLFVQDQIPLKNVFWRPCSALSIPCVGAVDGATIVCFLLLPLALRPN